MAKKGMKKCPTLSIIMGIQTQITRSYHLTPVRMAILKIPEITNTDKGVEKGSPAALLVGKETGAATMENRVETPQKPKNSATV